jgi:hypothetical protein
VVSVFFLLRSFSDNKKYCSYENTALFLLILLKAIMNGFRKVASGHTNGFPKIAEVKFVVFLNIF